MVGSSIGDTSLSKRDDADTVTAAKAPFVIVLEVGVFR